MTPDARLDYPATRRNRAPILSVLQRVLPSEGGLLVEIASGSGQHGAAMVGELPGWRWQPTDLDPDGLASIEAWRVHTANPNLVPALRLEVCAQPWPVSTANAVLCCNMIHISPWACTLGLFAGAASIVDPGGHVITYGPYAIDGVHTSQSNVAFDRRLRFQDPQWGVRNLEDVVDAAVGFELLELVAMPANNFMLVFRRA